MNVNVYKQTVRVTLSLTADEWNMARRVFENTAQPLTAQMTVDETAFAKTFLNSVRQEMAKSV